MDNLKWIIPAITGLMQLVIKTVNDAQASGEMTAEEAETELDRVRNIFAQEYARTDEERKL